VRRVICRSKNSYHPVSGQTQLAPGSQPQHFDSKQLWHHLVSHRGSGLKATAFPTRPCALLVLSRRRYLRWTPNAPHRL
jgi:hypothetical protein